MRNVVMNGIGVYVPAIKYIMNSLRTILKVEGLMQVVLWNIWEGENDILYQRKKTQLQCV